MKRYADRWSSQRQLRLQRRRGSNYASPASTKTRPTLEQSNGGQFAPESSGSGIDNIFTNAKWLVKANGLYTMWWDIGIAGNVHYRQEASPFPQAIQSPKRGRTARAARPAPPRRRRVTSASTACSWRTCASTRRSALGTFEKHPEHGRLQPHQREHGAGKAENENASNANYISGIVAPRVIRFGVRVTW